jgi:GNAT superfamily N-acetyltransferase
MSAFPPELISIVPTTPVDAALVTAITELVNRVYADAEDGMWQPGATRTSEAEIAELIRGGQLAVARQGGQLVGAIRVQQLATGDGEFGMLTAAPEHRGGGVGRALMQFAERLSRERGARVMQLELLVPRTWKHPFKEFLHGWYTRSGYRIVRVGTLDETYPALVRLRAPRGVIAERTCNR